MIDTVCIIGVGLIGGSLARGLRSKNWCQKVIGIDSNPNAIETALRLNVIDEGFASIDDCPIVPDIIVVAVPVLKIKEIFKQMSPWIHQCKAVTDVGSTKQNVLDAFKEIYADSPSGNCFVPGHPIAGRECSGVESSVEDLFADRKVILTPAIDTDADSVNIISEMWQQVDAHVERLDAKEHDTILAATSHLPHALAYALVHCLSTQSHTPEIFRYAAGGFADFTRIASSDPIVWRQICLANREELLKSIEHFDTSLQALRSSLLNEDGDALQKIFSEAKDARDRYTDC